jgi:hypothetical protein
VAFVTSTLLIGLLESDSGRDRRNQVVFSL